MVVVMMIPAIVVIVIAVRAVMMVMIPPTVTVMVIRSSVPDASHVGNGSWLGENVSAVVPTSEHQRIKAETGSTSCDYRWN